MGISRNIHHKIANPEISFNWFITGGKPIKFHDFLQKISKTSGSSGFGKVEACNFIKKETLVQMFSCEF